MEKRIWHSEEARQQFFFETYLKMFETEWRLFLAEYMRKAGSDPNQPRVPAGSPDGGQWTAEGSTNNFGGGNFISGNNSGRGTTEEYLHPTPYNIPVFERETQRYPRSARELLVSDERVYFIANQESFRSRP